MGRSTQPGSHKYWVSLTDPVREGAEWGVLSNNFKKWVFQNTQRTILGIKRDTKRHTT